MKQFNVLERSQRIHQNYLLEASAGTGKTYSIQNIVIRLLVESIGNESPLTLNQILVVTFTRAATQDLKLRIRGNIEQTLYYLDNISQEHLFPDFIKSIIEKGEKSVNEAKKRLKQALFSYDQAQIFTIHSFCARMLRQFALEGDIGLQTLANHTTLQQSELSALIHDFFRSEIHPADYSQAQLEIVLKKDPSQRKLIKLIQSGYAFPSYASFKELYEQFCIKMGELKQSLGLTSEKLIEDFVRQASSYRNYKNGATKQKTLSSVTRFAKLFDQEKWSVEDFDELIADGLIWIKALDPKNLKGKGPSAENLHYPSLTEDLRLKIHPLIDEGGNFLYLLSRIARECQLYLKRYQQEEEIFTHDDILRKMDAALERSSFAEKIQNNYQASIIDEFQDTDPIQWKIFKRLFLPEKVSWKGNLYLVGDPKQSIYSFRQADIYTYLSAAKAIGESNCYSLNMNYRSQPHLVQALNQLFASDHLPHFIPLPKIFQHLPYHKVEAASLNLSKMSVDEKGAVHFFMADVSAMKNHSLQEAESKVFFPFITTEIHRLKEQRELKFNQFAVLVRDRYQAIRLGDYFELKGIPFLNQRGASLAGSLAHQSLTAIIVALLHPQDRGAMREAFGSPLMGWTHDELKNPESIEFCLKWMQVLRTCLFENGFTLFFEELLQSHGKPSGQTVQEQILEREKGLEFYHDLLQIADLIIDHRYKEWHSIEGIIPFLDQLQTWDENDDERIKKYQDQASESVKILTLHLSKGLEFDIVFALGLVNRTVLKDDLIPIELKGKTILAPLKVDSEDYLRYCEECDSEKMRQLYVALTRAKTQLYIPVILHQESTDLQWGEASPMDLYLARLMKPAASYQTIYERIRALEENHLFDFFEKIGKDNHITYSYHSELFCELKKTIQSTAPSLQVPIRIKVPGKPLWMTSFSSLTHNLEPASSNSTASAPKNYDTLDKHVHTLPANHETGLLIHRILEKISFDDFHALSEADHALPIVHPFLLNSSFKEWGSPVANLLWNTLKTPIPQISSHFSLSRLRPKDFYRELPFIFPYKQEQWIEEMTFKEGFIKGVIDLLFIYDGLYYLVDWKTNWLGPHEENYTLSAMQQAMHDHAYFLQASIYTEAVRRYLKLVEPRPFEECFGGVFYLFLRGMRPGKDNGIFHFKSNFLC